MATTPPLARGELFDSAGADLLVHGDNLTVMRQLPDECVQLVYLDPPFNTGREQRRRTIRSVREASTEPDEAPSASPGQTPSQSPGQTSNQTPGQTPSQSTRPTPTTYRGFSGTTYTRTIEALTSYDDRFADYWDFLAPRLAEARRLLRDDGTLYLHLDWREAHYAKVALDALFGRDCFLNEIIWAYDYGAKSKSRWPTKHDTILVYVKNPDSYWFDSDTVDREPYMAPGLVTPEKAARGKLPTDVWWHTIVGTSAREKTGYPTQKPLGIVRRIVSASSRPGDWVLDPFAGSGTTAAAARELGRRSISIDASDTAMQVMSERLGMPVTTLN